MKPARERTRPVPSERFEFFDDLEYLLSYRIKYRRNAEADELGEPELQLVLEDLERRRRECGLKRVFGRRYMELRRCTEANLHELFITVGGQPDRPVPHYFVLDTSPWYRGLASDSREITVALSDFPPLLTSCTYPDSFTAMGFLPRFGLSYEPRPYHERVYRMDQLHRSSTATDCPAQTTPTPAMTATSIGPSRSTSKYNSGPTTRSITS